MFFQVCGRQKSHSGWRGTNSRNHWVGLSNFGEEIVDENLLGRKVEGKTMDICEFWVIGPRVSSVGNRVL